HYAIPVPDLPGGRTFRFSPMKSCAAGALSQAIVYAWQLDGIPIADRFLPSVPFIYWYARYLDGAPGEDVPVVLSNTSRASIYKGFCRDEKFSIDEVGDDFTRSPSTEVAKQALDNGVVEYGMLLRDPASVAACIASDIPVLMRIVIENEAESPPDGYAWAR